MHEDETLKIIEKVLQRYAELQSNLASAQARAHIASAIVEELRLGANETSRLSALVISPPSEGAYSPEAKAANSINI